MLVTGVEEGFVVMSDEAMTGRRLYASSEAVIIHMTINPGKAIEPHSAPVDMEFFVLEGEGLFTIGDEKALVRQGTLVAAPKGLAHGIANPGEAHLRILAVKNS